MGQAKGSAPPTLSRLLEEVKLHLACDSCSKRENESTFTLHPSNHTCAANLLLAKSQAGNAGEEWRYVRRRPGFPVPARYAVCWHYHPGRGCERHQQWCTFAWSPEERLVWSFEKNHDLQRNQLRSLLLPTKCPGNAPMGPTSWEQILSEFGGQFQEVCEQCSFQCPPKITPTTLCQSHPRPLPLLLHVVIDGTRKQCHAIRPMPCSQNLHLCSQPSRGLLCQRSGRSCPDAHSEVEMAVWQAERGHGLSRGQMPGMGDQQTEFYCHLCLVTATSQESFEAHCSSLEHGRMIADDAMTVWNYRALPLGMSHFTLCESPLQCLYGGSCPNAHSQEELQEWILRAKVSKRNKQVAEEEGLQSYQEGLIQEYQRCSRDTVVLSEEVEGVKVSCDLPLRVHTQEKTVTKRWTFTVKTKLPLLHVALLKSDPGATFSLLSQHLPPSCRYARGSSFKVKGSRPPRFDVAVRVQSSVFGVFEQWLVLDFGIRPVLVQKISLQVGCRDAAPREGTSDREGASSPSSVRWHSSGQLCIPCKARTEEEKRLLELYKPPAINLSYQRSAKAKDPLTSQNYRHRMHVALLREEAAREEAISRLNLKVSVTPSAMVTSSQGMKVAPPGDLFAEVPLPSDLTPDTEEGYLLYRSVTTALLAPWPSRGDKVYEVFVDVSDGSESSVLLTIPQRCCQELALEQGTSLQLEIQFQLDRLPYCLYHEAVDRLLDVKLVLPELSRCCLPIMQELPPWGNQKQQLAASYIIGSAPGGGSVPPLLIYGPFGTGKTYTMAKAALEVIKQPGTRVLICTHNNSAADLYVRDHFHPYVLSGHPEAAPLRVKFTLSPLNRTDPITLQYCPLTPDRGAFLNPPRTHLARHRIIVTTAITSRDLDVPRGYFSHILLDEAAQMLESEALMPLALADHQTRVVVTGDHMQETPRLFCLGGDERREEHTLLTRLFSCYQAEQCPAAKGGRIIFHQNYRSVPAIISFVSRCFYVGQGDAIEACAGAAAAPLPGRHALGLCHVHGPCVREGSSWVNPAEVLQVQEVIKEVLSQWPEAWGPVKHSSICVLSQGSQVKLIRQELRKVRLSQVTVGSYENILGQEFHVIIVSTVRSNDSLPSLPPTSSSFSLDFFCDPRILNTVLTRARSHLVIVGDVVALCSFGGCSRIWRRYVRECVEAGSVVPRQLSLEEIKQVVSDLQSWREQPEEEENIDSWTSDPDINSDDPILQELLDSKTAACVTVSEEGMLGVRSNPTPAHEYNNNYTDFPPHMLQQYLLIQPEVYKKCELVKEGFDRGYALTLEESSVRRIHIKGRANCGQAFSGDQVVVNLLPDTDPQAGKVVGVLSAAGRDQLFVCCMDSYDRNVMIPIDRTVTKIYCPLVKETTDVVPIRSFCAGQIRTLRYEKLTQEMRQKSAFLVQVTRWKQGMYYPLGIVTRILPMASTLEEGLDILDLDFGLVGAKQYPAAATKEAKEMVLDAGLEDGRQDCRGLVTFTVDPADAKDMDDAISVRELDGHYEIGVHITDLAALVGLGSELDAEAKKRGVTFYSSKREPVHMLPARLSSDRCSLKPQCDRRALSLFVLVEKGSDRMVEGHFIRTLIRSDRKLSYEEAESILRTQRGKTLAFKSVEDCVGVAGHFSRIHCAARLQEAATYKQPDEMCPPGARSARRMIEELMIMYNSWVAEYLTGNEPLKDLVPLRCQANPSPQKIEELRKRLIYLLPLSTYLSHHLVDVQAGGPPWRISAQQRVTMLTPVWNQLQDAATSTDYASVTDLLSTDDLHPELCHAAREFRRLLGRSEIRRLGTPSATGHYSLQLCAYTWASSPLRRYLDIAVQRLLQETLTGSAARVSAKNMDLMCHHFEKRERRANSYERKSWALSMALGLHEQVQQKLAVVVSAEPNSRNFQVIFPMNGDSLPGPVLVDYRSLQPVTQPVPIPGGTRLSYRRRVYSFISLRERPLKNYANRDITTFSATAWQDAVRAVSNGEPQLVLATLKKGVKVADPKSAVYHSKCGHYVDFTLDLHPGDSILLQLCTTIFRGLPNPCPQLCCLTPGIQLCLEHTERPVDCFSKLAHRGPRQRYRNPREYQQVWEPLCGMEAVVAAVSEGGGVMLRDVPVRWNERGNGAGGAVGLAGSFTLSRQLIKDCDLDMSFQHCYLCLRLEGLEVQNPETRLDVDTYSWVAHGLTDAANYVSAEEGGTVDFILHQATMHRIPDAVLCGNAEFTVEIIPKLLPDIRKEWALLSLESASELTKNIALGKQVSDTDINRRLRSQRNFDIPGHRRGLNPSQTTAVRTALTHPFTLIQGPPGTGKTVVGVHVVYWFHQMNENPEPEEGGKAGESDRHILMYCGPSNKSVDVVAEMLLPHRDQLRPLRVYSEQMELSEFPYPGSGLRMSRYRREGKINAELRPITLHHLIRQPSNPHHGEILRMDRRIQDGEEISPEDLEEYKQLLSKARGVELARHDIILCTCIAASSRTLISLPVSQLVIDECGMCTEPETLVPLVSHKFVQTVVLLGDHRQLRPVVLHDLCRTLRMDRSLFERYQEEALLLDTQYRMHPEICEFPSQEFYDGRLRTSDQLHLQHSKFRHPYSACCPLVFGEVEGQEQSLTVTSEEGNVNSKANLQEAEQAVRLVILLTNDRSVAPEDIAILTPYNAQVSEVTKRLKVVGLTSVTVSTIMKSQGSEWRYVILSTVRSAPPQELDTRPTLSWLRMHLGFLSDPNQINVGLTRAKEGLCVLGNSHLLRCCPLWRRLLQHYRQKNAIVPANEIQVTRRPRP